MIAFASVDSVVPFTTVPNKIGSLCERQRAYETMNLLAFKQFQVASLLVESCGFSNLRLTATTDGSPAHDVPDGDLPSSWTLGTTYSAEWQLGHST